MQANFTINETHASYALGLIESDIAALHNHIASAVECGADEYGGSGQTGTEYAQGLVIKLRRAQAAAVALRRQLNTTR